MNCIIFNGKEFAFQKEFELKNKVTELQKRGIFLAVKSFIFVEDEGSVLYTKLKKAAAQRIGLSYQPQECFLRDPIGRIRDNIFAASHDSHLTGLMVQKPSQQSWEISNTQHPTSNFRDWWAELTSAIDPKKDVDCLTTHNLDRVTDPGARVFPATVKACLSILEEAKKELQISDDEWKHKKVLVIGRSDIVGMPLTRILRKRHTSVMNVGRKELPQTSSLAFDIIVSATGVSNLVTGSMVKTGVIVVDVGAPSGDIERSSVESRAAFLTPVPGGVGPVTVVSLMENIVTLGGKYE